MAEPVPNMCEYCDQIVVPAYAWHADTWCRSCAEARVGPYQLEGNFDDAPIFDRGEVPAGWGYSRPFILGWRAYP